MIAVALKGLAGRKIRALLTAFAIVIGVSMVAGTFILTDTLQGSLTSLEGKSTSKTDVAIFEKEIVKGSQGAAVTIPAELLVKVQALPEVAEAAGEIAPQKDGHVADIIGRDGRPSTGQSFGRGFDPKQAHLAPISAGAFSPFKLKSGDWPEGSDQVVIDAHTAAEQHFKAGDTIEIATATGRHRYELSGTVGFLGEELPPRPSVAAWDLETAQAVLGRDGRYDVISIAAKPGVTPERLLRAVKPLLPASLTAKGNAQAVKDAEKELDRSMLMVRAFLLGFAFIALLVGAFVIFNALSITVAQRTREFATLRTLGASRKQVMRSVRLEGLVLGLLASVIGLAVGLGVAQSMMALIAALGFEFPKQTPVVATHTVTISLILGTGVTLLASLVPARRATRVPPIAAVREGATLPQTKLAERSHGAGIVITATSLLAIAFGAFSGSAPALIGLSLAGGLLGLFAGIALLAPRLVAPLVTVVGWPARRLGGAAGGLASANAVRNPGRTASTAATLMIGLTLVTVVAMLGAGLRVSTEQAVSDQYRADYVVDAKSEQGFKAAGGEALAAVDGVRAVSHVRSEKALLLGTETAISGIDEATIGHFYRFTWKTGSLARLGDDGAIVTAGYAKKKHLALGRRLPVTLPSGEKRTLVVRGIYDVPNGEALLGNISIGRAAFDAAFTNAKTQLMFLDTDAGARPALDAAARGMGDGRLRTGAGYAKAATSGTNALLAMLYVLLGFSIVVSLFGMANTMVLSVFERTREIGMLRTLGLTRRQARRMIRHESIITALIGATLGLGLGVFVAAIITAAVPGLALAIPLQSLTAFTLVAVLAGVAAAVLPARRASRLDVLKALQYE